MQPDFEVWKEYAYEQGIHPAVISYLELRRKNFYRMENTVDGRILYLMRVEIFYESQGIFMDKHRSRLPVLYIRKHDILKVKWADNDSKYISINKEMRKELKKIYDDSEIESINS